MIIVDNCRKWHFNQGDSVQTVTANETNSASCEHLSATPAIRPSDHQTNTINFLHVSTPHTYHHSMPHIYATRVHVSSVTYYISYS